MTTKRLWRVDSTHVCGYNAPKFILETEKDRLHEAEQEALKLAKKMSRLSDFPSWRFSVTLVSRRNLNGKWFTEAEWERRLQLAETKDDWMWAD